MVTAWSQHGHTQCVRNTHLLGNLGHAPPRKIIHSEKSLSFIYLKTCTKYTNIAFLPEIKYHSFSLTCMLASRPLDLRFPHYFYPGTSEFYVGTGQYWYCLFPILHSDSNNGVAYSNTGVAYSCCLFPILVLPILILVLPIRVAYSQYWCCLF